MIQANLRAWLFTVLHNVHISGVRRLMCEQGSGIAASASLALAQSEPSARLDLLDVERAIGKLAEPERRVILLIGLEGMRYDNAAEILGVPIGTVRSRLARARSKLRKLLECDIESAASDRDVSGWPPTDDGSIADGGVRCWRLGNRPRPAYHGCRA